MTVTLSPSDGSGDVSGVQKTQYRLSGSGTWLDTTSDYKFTDAIDGTRNYEYQAIDNAGNVSDTGTCAVKIDTTNPTVTDNADTAWHNSDVTVTLSPLDGGSGVQKTQYRKSGSSTWLDTTADYKFTVSAAGDHSNDGVNNYQYRAIDNAGNVSATGTCAVKIDTTDPTVTDNADTAWHNSDQTVTLTALDGGSGVATVQYRKGTSGSWTTGTSIDVSAASDHSNDGVNNYQYQAIDNAGNVSSTGTCAVKIDTTNPTVTDNADTAWHNSDVTVTLSPLDGGSGVAKTQYRAGSSGTWLDAVGNQFTVTAASDHSNDGVNNYQYRALDNAGNVSSTGSCAVKIDTTVPTVTDNADTAWHNSDVTITLSPLDGGSGVQKTQYRAGTSGTWLDTSANTFTVTAASDHSNDGVNTYQYRALDNAGNVSDTGTCAVKIDTLTRP